MGSIEERPLMSKFNVNAKPFEILLPKSCEPLSSESSENSDYCGIVPIYLMADFVEASVDGENDEDGNYYDCDQTSDDNCSPDLQDSAIDNNENFLPPDDDLRDKIVKQVEFYFSDVNLTKDAFLLKHVKRNKEGYVSLKLISSFKKVKALTKDWRVVAYSLKFSDRLYVNDSGTKVKRKDPLPPYDETTPSRTVIAMNLPMERPTVESVTELFSKCGEIALIRILRPGTPIPPDVKQFVNKHPGIGTSMCAVIEFVAPDAAEKAVKIMDSKNKDWRSMHVVEMAKGKKAAKNQKKESPKSEGEEAKKEEKKKKKKRSPRIDQLKNQNDIDFMIGPDFEDPSPRSRRKTTSLCLHPAIQDTPLIQFNGRLFNPRVTPIMNGEGKARPKSASFSEATITNGGANMNNCPWVQRRLMAAKENGQSPLRTNRQMDTAQAPGPNSTKILIPEGVIRLPRGPDGTNGFYNGLGRGKKALPTECMPVTLVIG